MATTLATLKSKVLKRIDETVPQLSDGTVNQYNVDEFLNEATSHILCTAPLHVVPITEITESPQRNNDGSGSVSLPNGFIRLIEFKMKGWERPIVSAITVHSAKYNRQHNRFIRGGVSKPVVAMVQDKLEYYSLPDGASHEIERARCVVKCEANELPERLHEPLCWLTASLILGVMNEEAASLSARKRFDELIVSLYGDNSV